MSTVTLYERPGCHLCEQALAVLLQVQARTPFVLHRLNIEEDAELHQQMLERIPVISVDGREAFQFFVDGPALERILS